MIFYILSRKDLFTQLFLYSLNNIINKDLTFKFDGHPVNTALISFSILLLLCIISGFDFSYLIFIIFLLITIIVLTVINKLSIYFVSFDNDNIIIKNKFKSYSIYYREGIKIGIKKGMNTSTETYRRFFKERRYRYSLVIKNRCEDFVLASTVGDDSIDTITKFIENFYYDENIKTNEVQLAKTYIRFDNKFNDKQF